MGGGGGQGAEPLSRTRGGGGGGWTGEPLSVKGGGTRNTAAAVKVTAFNPYSHCEREGRRQTQQRKDKLTDR